jgi:hypothetical protein
MAMAPVTTRSYDNARSNTTYAETILTADAVRQRGIGRLFSIPLPGDARGTEAQPLIAPHILCEDGYYHDLLIVSTMGNMLYAFDANAPEPRLIWAQRLGNPVLGSRKIDNWGLNTHWGILSTGVIDLASQIHYGVSYDSTSGDYQDGQFLLHATNLRNGSSAAEPLSLEDATHNPGLGIKPVVFSGVQRKQRASLLLTAAGGKKILFIGAGSIFESLASNLGWVIAVDIAKWSIADAFAVCPRKGGGGIWMAGAGIAATKTGDLVFVTGNGHFDDATERAESCIRMPFDKVVGKFSKPSWFTPFMDDMRDGAVAPAGATTNMNGWDDQDLGCSGVTVIEDLGLVIFSGKDGIVYVAKLANLGNTTLAQLKAGSHYGALAWPPIWFTYYPGPDKDAAPADPTDLNFNFGGVTHHMHSSAGHYMPEGAGGRHLVYCWGENGNLRAWNLQATGELRYRGASVEQASWQDPGMPGGMISISANGEDPNSGIVWGLSPALDANRVISPGRLTAHSATNLLRQPDGSMQIETLWRSTDWDIGFTHNKFDIASVSGGRVFVPTYSATLDVWGLTLP